MAGVTIGLSDLHIAILTEDPAKGGKATYETPERVAGAITANVNPNTSSETLFADDGPYESATTMGEVEVEIGVVDLPLELQAKILGHTLTPEGVLIRKSTDTPPYLALGFKSLKSNGKYRYTWLAKGKFMLPEQANETKGDSVSFNTPTATAAFVKRECDDEWERHIDADTTGFTPEQGEKWFSNPYGDGTVTPPVGE